MTTTPIQEPRNNPMTTLTVDQLRQLALEETKLAADAAAITHRRDEIKAILRTHLPVGRTQADDFTITIQKPRQTLNLTRLAAAYPFDTRPDLWTTQIDRDRVKAAIAPNDLAQFMTESAPVVTVTPTDLSKP